jgi:hypothetical protein
MDTRTDAQTENIYSIFRDKLLLLGEHVQETELKKDKLQVELLHCLEANLNTQWKQKKTNILLERK